jgi:TadE-like protein
MRHLMSKIKRRLRHLVRLENGNALIELAVAVPILLLLTIGVVDYARLYFTEIAVANAARSGAEYGVKTSGNVDSMKYGAALEAGKDSVGMVISAGLFCSCPSGDRPVPDDCIAGSCGTYGIPRDFDSVAVSKTVSFIFHYPGLPASLLVTRKSILRGN